MPNSASNDEWIDWTREINRWIGKKKRETYLSRTLNRQMMELTNNPPHRSCWLNHLKYWKISGCPPWNYTNSSHKRQEAVCPTLYQYSRMWTSSNFQGLKRCVSIVFRWFCFMFRFVYLTHLGSGPDLGSELTQRSTSHWPWRTLAPICPKGRWWQSWWNDARVTGMTGKRLKMRLR